MSPTGVDTYGTAGVWSVTSTSPMDFNAVTDSLHLRPVLNLKADTVVIGLGDSDNRWVVAN